MRKRFTKINPLTPKPGWKICFFRIHSTWNATCSKKKRWDMLSILNDYQYIMLWSRISHSSRLICVHNIFRFIIYVTFIFDIFCAFEICLKFRIKIPCKIFKYANHDTNIVPTLYNYHANNQRSLETVWNFKSLTLKKYLLLFLIKGGLHTCSIRFFYYFRI